MRCCLNGLLLLLFIMAACRTTRVRTRSVLLDYGVHKLDSIPSASGVVIYKNWVYVVGDDATGIYKMDVANFTYIKNTDSIVNYSPVKIPVKGLPFNKYREEKPVKHDFESACLVTWYNQPWLMAWGSGSLPPNRDSLLLMNLERETDQRMIAVQGFYTQLQQLTGTDSTQWNMEGATVAGESLYLCNRGNNFLISLNLEAVLTWLFNQSLPFPAVAFHRVNLPQIEGKEARLSGVCTVDANLLLFTASVEDTPDWTKDGPILGSYLCLYSLKKRKVLVSYDRSAVKDKKEKMEAIDIISKDGNSVRFIMLADNDDGSSNLYYQTLAYGGVL